MEACLYWKQMRQNFSNSLKKALSAGSGSNPLILQYTIWLIFSFAQQVFIFFCHDITAMYHKLKPFLFIYDTPKTILDKLC